MTNHKHNEHLMCPLIDVRTVSITKPGKLDTT